MSEFDPIAYVNEPRWQESRLGLDRIRELLERMGRPQDRLKFVHVAGTNGKGSTCAYLAAILEASGLRTGLFTSPYIFQFEERIRVNGSNIPVEALRDITLFVRDHAEAMFAETGEHPTEFELMCAIAFEHFARERCDLVVCEVGLGGRLDSTNVIEEPEACIICRIGLDHTDLLGDTLAAIAREKAGIVKPGAPVVSWPQEDAGAMEAIEGAVRAAGVRLVVPDFSQLEVAPVGGLSRTFAYRGTRYATKMLGSYQPANATLALETARLLRERGWDIPDESIAGGIAAARWPGRFEVVEAGPPPLVVDGGHNPQGAVALAASLRDVYPGRSVVFVMGVLADKDYPAMIAEVVPLGRAFICIEPPNPRALAAADLAAAIRQQADVPAYVEGDPSAAFDHARALAAPDDVICSFGSLYSIAALAK